MPATLPKRAVISRTTDLHTVGERAAVGVAERDPLGAGADRRVEAAQRVVRVAVVPVEEVLGVVHDAPAVRRRTSAPCRRSSRGSRRSWCAARRRPGGPTLLPTSVMIGAIESSSVRSCRSSCGRTPGPPGGPERGERRVAQRVACCIAAKNSVSVGIGAGPAALDDGDAERVEMLGDAQLVGHREVDADTLRAVAQRGVVDLDAHDAAPTVHAELRAAPRAPPRRRPRRCSRCRRGRR